MKTVLGFAAALLLSGAAWAQDAHDHADHAGHDHAPPEPVGEAPSHVFTEAPEDRAMGEADAPHTLIVYASNTCPHCQSWFTQEWPVVKDELVDTGKLRLVYRPIPTSPTQLSMVGFMIAECAGSDDAYFDSILYQYDRQGVIFDKAKSGGLREEYAEIGRRAGLADEAALTRCLGDAERLARIQLASRRANHGRVAGIPSFVLDGEAIDTQETAASLLERLSD